jgi:hypothetical protein
MKSSFRPCLLAAALAAAWPAPAPAQVSPHRSHVPIAGGVAQDLADNYLRDRLSQAETSAELERLFADLAKHPEQHGIKPEDQPKLRQALEKAGDRPEKALEDPEFRRLLIEAAEKHKGNIQAGPEEMRRWEDLVNRYTSPSDRHPPEATRPDSQGPKPSDPGGASRQGDKLPEGPKPVPPTPPVAPPTSSPPPRDRAGNEQPPELADDWVPSFLADSPTFRELLLDLNRLQASPSGDTGGDWDRWGQRFADLGKRFPSVSWPKFDFPSRREPPVSEEAVVPGRTEGVGAAGRVVLLVAAVLAALLGWGLLRRQGLGLLRPAAASAWRLGPWPVRPEAVSTRDELVRAFEYLALLLLGPVARNRNHRDIAADLVAADATRRGAAERLAALYEQARYAPPDEALPDAELAAARADLSRLAGVAVA